MRQIRAERADVRMLLGTARVIPVLTVTALDQAEPLAHALVAGGLPVLEVTLRSTVALEALARMARVPGVVVGAGTVLSADQYDDAVSAGARFVVGPGATDRLYAAADRHPVPYLPGVATPSEAMAAREAGITVAKFFPAEVSGGVAWLRAAGAPLPGLAFCPTGGITADTAPDYLALPNVACVGGTWVAPEAAIEAGDWAGVERRARAAPR